MENRIPTRDINDYKGLKRSVAQNHFRVEDKKAKEHRSTNVLEMFLKSKWILWLYHYIKSRFGPRHKFQTYEGSADKGIYKLHSANNSAVKIALAADWGTDTAESQQVGLAIAKQRPDYTIHLGDTYYVGAPHEIENNFKPGNSFWPYGSVGSFALTGNHEMYSNGDPYYDILLKYMGLYTPDRIVQKTSYFCLENDYWRIIGLDTGYRSVGIPLIEILFSNADLRPEVIKWLENDVRIKEDNRGIIFLTHHQYFSAFESGYPKAAAQLQKIIGKNRKVLWFWGHEHRFAIYGKHSLNNGITAYGRCIGHGGMPASVFNEQRKKLK
ncbi:MAG TPA: metallophosphoesterase, partial [Segetibacter sp.]|nr:metallophosphoesterase [Segetibacter sp.]